MEDKIQSYFDMNVWKKAHQLTLNIYKVANAFPQNEQFTLVDQIKRATSAVTICISEGFQKRNRNEKSRLYIEAQDNISDIYYLLYLSKDLGYIKNEELLDSANEIQRMLSGLIRSVLSGGGGNKHHSPNKTKENDMDGYIAGNYIDDVDML
jgi:four helix bundle protein